MAIAGITETIHGPAEIDYVTPILVYRSPGATPLAAHSPVIHLSPLGYVLGILRQLHAPAVPQSVPGTRTVYTQASQVIDPTYMQQAQTLQRTPGIPVSGAPGC